MGSKESSTDRPIIHAVRRDDGRRIHHTNHDEQPFPIVNSVNLSRIDQIEREYTTCNLKVVVKKIHKQPNHKLEFKELARLIHPNILPILGLCNNNDCYDITTLITVFAENGTLQDAIHHQSEKIDYTNRDAFSWMDQIASAVAYIHANKVMHKNLCTRKVLLSNNYTRPLLGNFNLTRSEDTNGYDRHDVWHIAGEVFTGERYTPSCDVYAMGFMLWEVFTRRYPFDECSFSCHNNVLVVAQTTGELGLRPTPLTENDTLNDLMQDSWASCSKQRPTMDEFCLRLKECKLH
jgi:serine/threonine protein kinase